MTDFRSAQLSRLTLTGFRNYETLTLSMAAKLIAFVGPNGAGKTNILEAVSFLTAGRGLRRAALADIARSGGDGGWSVAATVLLDGLETKIGTGLISGTSGRKVRIDGQDVKGSESLLDYMRVLWLVPSMDGLFTGGASDRRRFLDRLTLALDPGHGRRVGDFETSLRQRNRLLENGGDDAYLTALEQQVAELGAAVSLARLETVDLLGKMLKAQAEEACTPFPTAAVTLEGAYETEMAGLPASDQEDHYRHLLRSGRYRDRAAGRTLTGPHLSDLKVVHLAKNMPAAQSSTGEQKALLIGLILAHAELTAKVSGMTPVLLLDEVAAHLDPDRRAALFDKLDVLGGQVFMTGTDTALFEALPGGSELFEIRDHSAQRL
ncbi:DNA replication/repair protein RecF [Roseibium denhamense]|uniref:DNA replication and repair protein RecF n=1 Tax=Roseibium denhamense TaxID=76305 RepID=A0ABY1PP18_9HYPH|nr:DNA replication/repair protein RecF [Roseibium denhamense]MTI06964.1 DNA replication/repair protein RecF [Roseibium denhamense]SMP36701.1 DNA replication and repair protein RecF [Roseibium denhamense]